MSTSRDYHHGDLRQTLIATALTALEADGGKPLSLRELARRAGVSPAAPYRHFTDLAALNRAVATDGFKRFRAAMEAAREEHIAPREQLVSMSDAYVKFALKTPQLFRLMFSAGVGADEDPTLRAAGQAAYGTLAAVAGRLDPDAPAEAALEAWAFVHGLAMLLLDGQLPGVGLETAGTLARRLSRRRLAAYGAP